MSVPAANGPSLLRSFGRELAAAAGLLAQNFLGSGLTLGGARCLYEIGAAGTLNVSELAAICGLDLGYVSRLVTGLAGAGLVQKTKVSKDGRARALSLTDAGRRLLGEMEKQYDARLGAWAGSKPRESYDALIEGIARFLDDGERPVILRDARPGDAGRIIQRHAQIYGDEFGYPRQFEAYVIRVFAAFFEGYVEGKDRIIVAERNGAFVGSVAVKVHSDAESQLRFLIVERAERGGGVGRRLVEAAVDHARAIKSNQMFLETASDLAAARAIYASIGFRHVRSEPTDWLPPGVLSETWALMLAPGSESEKAKRSRARIALD